MEKWIQVKEYPKYYVSNMGNVKTCKGNVLRPFDRLKYGNELNRGYLTVHLCNGGIPRYKNVTVHSLVMSEFVGPRPKGFVINHKNGIRWDNRLDNLEYCTQSHNRKEDFIHGRQSLVGEKNTQSKLKESDVLEIVRLYKSGEHSFASLGKIYGVHRCGISNIMNGHCWSYLTGIKKRY